MVRVKKSSASKSFAGKVWHFIWEDDSIASWLVNILLAFLIIKFIVYPGLGFVLGTTHPIVAVVSGSMEHKLVHPCIEYDKYGNCAEVNKNLYDMCGVHVNDKQWVTFDYFWKSCGSWYRPYSIEQDDFKEFPFHNGFNTGDIMLLHGKKIKDIEVGDVIVFQGAYRAEPTIHRVINISHVGEKTYFHTKGDHNSGSNDDELMIPEDLLVGYSDHGKGSVALVRVPYLGYVKMAFVKIIQLILTGLGHIKLMFI